MKESEKLNKTADGSVESIDLLDDWKVGADGIPVKKGDYVTEEDGELVYLHSDGRKTRFIYI